MNHCYSPDTYKMRKERFVVGSRENSSESLDSMDSDPFVLENKRQQLYNYKLLLKNTENDRRILIKHHFLEKSIFYKLCLNQLEDITRDLSLLEREIEKEDNIINERHKKELEDYNKNRTIKQKFV